MSTLEKLETFLKSNRVEVRRKAVTMLGEIKSENGVPFLLTALDDSDEIVRAIANLENTSAAIARGFWPLNAYRWKQEI